jgi:hypothetical protein
MTNSMEYTLEELEALGNDSDQTTPAAAPSHEEEDDENLVVEIADHLKRRKDNYQKNN